MKIGGGCFCGAVRYEVDGEVGNVTVCHCRSCQKIAAAPALPWFTVSANALQWQGAAPLEFASSPGVTRGFCAACGTPLSYRSDQAPGELDVTLCSLDDPAALPPRDHTWTSHRLPWEVIGDGLAQFPRSRGEGR